MLNLFVITLMIVIGLGFLYATWDKSGVGQNG